MTMDDDMARAARALRDAVENPGQLDELDPRAVRELLATLVKAYVALVEHGREVAPLLHPDDPGGPTATEALVVVTDLLEACDVELFELAMWQSMGTVRVREGDR